MSLTFPKLVSVKSALMRGAGWGGGMRWSIKIIGMVNAFVLARLLSPEDYGIVTMAMLMVSVLIDFGAETNVLREQSPSRELIDSAWSLRVIQRFHLGVVLACLAPMVGIRKLVGSMSAGNHEAGRAAAQSAPDRAPWRTLSHAPSVGNCDD
jgi:O-antigen/teichoic acid export membrane protein